MRKIAFLSFATLAVMTAGAQTKGSLMIGGSLATQNQEQTQFEAGESLSQKRTDLVVTPRIGYFITNNLAVGAEVSFASIKGTATSSFFQGTQKQTLKTLTAGVFVRRYWEIGKSFSVFGHGGVSYLDLHGKSGDQIEFKEVLKGNGYTINLYPGVNYTLGRRLMIDIALRDLISFTSLNTTTIPDAGSGGNSSNSSFTLGGDMSIGAGLHLLIGK